MAIITAAVRMAQAENAKGVFPPILRAIGHLSACAMQLMAEEQLTEFTVPNEDYIAEIDHAISHWEIVVRPVYINQNVIEKIREISGHWNILRTSVTADDRATLYRNTMTMMEEIISLGVMLDLSAWGLKHPDDSDAGRAL